METVISLQHPTASLSRSTKAVLPSELGRGRSGHEGSWAPQLASPQAPAGRGDAPSHRLPHPTACRGQRPSRQAYWASPHSSSSRSPA